MHWLTMIVLLQQQDGVFVQQNRSVGEHVDKKHDEKFQSFEKKNFLIFTTPVSLHCKNFGVQLAFNKTLEIAKNMKNIRPFL